jgi:hypothetical protein
MRRTAPIWRTSSPETVINGPETWSGEMKKRGGLDIASTLLTTEGTEIDKKHSKCFRLCFPAYSGHHPPVFSVPSVVEILIFSDFELPSRSSRLFSVACAVSARPSFRRFF